VRTGWKCSTLLAPFEEHKTNSHPILSSVCNRHARLRTLDRHFTMVNLPLNCSNKVQAHKRCSHNHSEHRRKSPTTPWWIWTMLISAGTPAPRLLHIEGPWRTNVGTRRECPACVQAFSTVPAETAVEAQHTELPRQLKKQTRARTSHDRSILYAFCRGNRAHRTLETSTRHIEVKTVPDDLQHVYRQGVHAERPRKYSEPQRVPRSFARV
jgi:hypothetical protein